MVGIDSGGSTRYWTFRGKTYYSYASWKAASDAYAASIAPKPIATVPKAPTYVAPVYNPAPYPVYTPAPAPVYRPPAYVAPKPVATLPKVDYAAQQRAREEAARREAARQAAIFQNQQRLQREWEIRQKAMLAQKAAAQKAAMEAAAAERARVERARQMAELQARQRAASEKQKAILQQQMARLKAQEQAQIARTLRARAYSNLAITNKAKLAHLQSQAGQRLDAVRSPLMTPGGQQDQYARRQIEARRGLTLDTRLSRRGPQMMDVLNDVEVRNQQRVERARASGNWDDVLRQLDEQSRLSGGRYHDEFLYSAIQQEVVAPVVKIEQDARVLFSEYDAAEVAGDWDRMGELVEENASLVEQYIEWFGDGLRPGKASKVFDTLTAMARRRDRIWLATLGGSRSIAGMSEAEIDALEKRAMQQITVNRAAPKELEGEERGGPSFVTGPLAYAREIRDEEGRPVNIIAYGVDAYLARERDREQARYYESYLQGQIQNHRMLEGGYEQVTNRYGQTTWRRVEVGDTLENLSQIMGVSEQSLMGRYDGIAQSDNPEVQEIELRRFLNEIRDTFRENYIKTYGRHHGRVEGQMSGASAGREKATREYMDRVTFALTGVKGGGIDYEGIYLPPIAHMLTAMQDPVNDVVNHWTDFTRPGTAQHADIQLWNEDWDVDINFENEIRGTAAAGSKYDPVVRREYERWLENRNHPDGDVRSAANRRWRHITLTGSVSFLADVVLDPLNALGMLTRPFSAARLVGRTAARIDPITGAPIGPQTAIGRMGRYLTPQVQSPKQAGWQNTFNYHHVRMDRALVDAARELNIPIKTALNYSDGQWEEFFRVRNMGEEAVGATQIGKDLFQPRSVNRTQLMTVIQQRLPQIMKRHGVSFADPSERLRQMQHLLDAKKSSDSQLQIVADLERKLTENADAIQALRTIRNTRGDRAGAEQIASYDKRIRELEGRRVIVQRQMDNLVELNATRAARTRRASGMTDEQDELRMILEARIAALKGGNPMKARELQDRIAQVKAALRRGDHTPKQREALNTSLAKLEDELLDLPGIENRREWHRLNRELITLRDEVQMGRRSEGIYTHFNTKGRLKQLQGKLRAEVNARVKSAWGGNRGLPSPFGRGLYLSADDTAWSGWVDMIERTVRSGGKGKKKGGGVMPSNKKGGQAVTRAGVRFQKEKLSRGFYQLNPGMTQRIKRITNITEMRAAFKEAGLTYSGKFEDLTELADALKQLGYVGIEITGLSRRTKSAAWAKLRGELHGDLLVLFDPEKAGAWIDDVSEAVVDVAPVQKLLDDVDEAIDTAKRKADQARREYAASKKVELRTDSVSKTVLRTKGGHEPLTGRVLRYITREMKPPRGMRAQTDPLAKVVKTIAVEVEVSYADIVSDLSVTTKQYRGLLDSAMRDMDIVMRADELLKIPGRSGSGALREAQARLKDTLKEMQSFEDQVVFEAGRPPENVFDFHRRKVIAKATGQPEPKKLPSVPKSETYKKGLITRRMELLGDYHRTIGGDPNAPSFVDLSVTRLRQDRLWLRSMKFDAEYRIKNAKSPAQAELFMRQLAQIEEAQKGLEIEFNILDRGRRSARKYAVSNVERVKKSVRPQRLAHLARDEQGRLFGASDDINRRLRRVEDVLSDDPAMTQPIRDALDKFVPKLQEIKANQIEIIPGSSKTVRSVVQLENMVGQGELSLYDAYIITEGMIKNPAYRATHTRLNRHLGRRILKVFEDGGMVDANLASVSRMLRTRHQYFDLEFLPGYFDYKRLDAQHAAELEKVRGYKAVGQVHLPDAPKKPTLNRGLGSHDSDPMVLGVKLKLARETGIDMFVYDDLRATLGDIMLRENRSAALFEDATNIAGKNGTDVLEEMRKLRELRAEQEAIRNFEEFATRPQYQGLPLERVLVLFEEINVMKDLAQTPPLMITKVQKRMLENAWREITGFEHSNEMLRSAWLQRTMVNITDPAWVEQVRQARILLAEDAQTRRENLDELLKVREINRKRAERALPIFDRKIEETVGDPSPANSNDLGSKASIQQLWDDPVPGAPPTRPGYLYHGTPFDNKESWIDASGNLHIRGSDDAARKGVPWIDEVDRNIDPRMARKRDQDRGAFLSIYPGHSTAFKEGLTSGGVERPGGGFLFEIDFRVFRDGSLYRNPRQDSRRTLDFDKWGDDADPLAGPGDVEWKIHEALENVDLDEIIFHGDLVVPKGAFRVYAKDPGTPVDIDKLLGWTDEAQSWTDDELFEYLTKEMLIFEDDFSNWMADFRKVLGPTGDRDVLQHELLRRIDQVPGFEASFRQKWLMHDKAIERYYTLVEADDMERAARAKAGDPFAWERTNDAAEDTSEMAYRAAQIKDSHLDYFDSIISEARRTMASGTYRPADMGEMAQLVPTGKKHPYEKVIPRTKPTLSRSERIALREQIASSRRTLDAESLTSSPPPLHRRDLMREWLVKEGRWDPENGEAIRLGRRVWSVDEERGFYMDNWGVQPVWTDDDWLAVVLRDQRAYQRAFREVGFSDEAFEALADGEVTGVVIRGKDLKDAISWGKEGFKAQRTLSELREWAIGRYGARVAVDGKFHAMPWLMKVDHTEYFPWLRHALGLEGRKEFEETLGRAKPKMGAYLKEQYFEGGMLRPLGLDIDPSLLGAKNPDDAARLMNSLGDALYAATENRINRLKSRKIVVDEEWMSEEVIRFSYDVMESLMTDQRWRGVFRGRSEVQQLLHMAGWQRTIVSFNPAFGVMNLAESYGYKRGLLAAVHNGWMPMSITGAKYDFIIPTLDVIDDSASRIFGLEGKAKFGARFRDEGLSRGMRFRGTVDDLANWGAHASKAGEEALRLDFARVIAGQAYESAIHQGMSKTVAVQIARMHAKRMVEAYFASVGDNAVMQAFNQMIPFFSYRLKQMTLAVTMSVKHPWIPLLLGKIQTAIIDANRRAWIDKHGSEMGFDAEDQRTHSLWFEIDGEFYGLDLWDASDWTRGVRQVIKTSTLGLRVQDALGEFFRAPHPLQLGIYALLTGTETPWGKEGDWRETFWWVDAALWMMGKDYDNPRDRRDPLQFGTQMLFFSGLRKMTEVDQYIMTYYAMKESGDNYAAQKYYNEHPEIAAYFEMMKPWRKPRWDPWGGRSESWYRDMTDEARDEYDRLYGEFNALKKTLDEAVFEHAAAPWSTEYRAAKKRRDLVMRQWHNENPLLSRMWALDVPYKEFVRLQEDWVISGQVDTWFYLLDKRPKRADFATELEYTQAQVAFNKQKAEWLAAHPGVSERLYESNNELVEAWHDQELHWSEILDFQSRINLRILEEEEKGAAADPDLVDLLYQVKGDTSAMLDAETYAFTNENLVPGSNRLANRISRSITARAFGTDMERLKSTIQIPGFADYRYGNASPEERVTMLHDAQYYDKLGSLAEEMKRYRDEEFSDKNDWWGQLEKRGLLDRYLKENPHKKPDYEYVVAIGNVVTNYGKNFWSGLMEPGNKWLLDEYLKRNPEARVTYDFMRGLDGIWSRIGNDFTRFYSELAKDPWLEAEYFRRNPEKAQNGYNSAYAVGMRNLMSGVGSGADFYNKLNANPWLRDEYFRRNPEKKAQYEANQAYIAALTPWINALKRSDFVAAQAAWDAMPAWARERYLAKHPDSGMADGMGGGGGGTAVQYKGQWFKSPESRDRFIAYEQRGPSTAVEYKGQWFKSPESRDRFIAYERGEYSGPRPEADGERPPYADGEAPKFRSPESRARFLQGQQYYAALGGWIELLKADKHVEADKYFRNLPTWVKEKYWAKNPDKRAQMELDSKMLADGAEYFLAVGEDKQKVLNRNPELVRWLQQHGGQEAEHRGLIIAMYRAIPSRDSWLKRTFREKFPEIFSKEAAGERKMKQIALKLAENPDMLPYYERAVKLQYEIYAQQVKLMGKVPEPWTMERTSRLKKRRKRRAAAFSAHYQNHAGV